MKGPYLTRAEAPPCGTKGYILLEAVVAMVVLSLGIYAVHGTIRQAIITRGQSQDYTRVQFLLEEVMAYATLQPLMQVGEASGRFVQLEKRFAWKYTIRKVDVPSPTSGSPGALGDEDPLAINDRVPYLAHVHATVTWKRAGREFSESMETLYNSNSLWIAPVQPEAL